MEYFTLFLSIHIILLTAIITVAVEVITLAGRFLLGVTVFNDTPGRVRKLTFGYRIHHSYFGIAGLFAGLITGALGASWFPWMVILGGALLISDLVHHFCVLWPLTGHHEFFLSFPE